MRRVEYPPRSTVLSGYSRLVSTRLEVATGKMVAMIPPRIYVPVPTESDTSRREKYSQKSSHAIYGFSDSIIEGIEEETGLDIKGYFRDKRRRDRQRKMDRTSHYSPGLRNVPLRRRVILEGLYVEDPAAELKAFTLC
ncbi:unnamed protein product [Nezara viridula]|uniref:Uncharacterized protein n=1 Tax=Nezara viridula TaxID=85310 RepID=A0A9P0MRS1_NEZVI|nr:unnamed protein product [Nezara viridula]